MKSCPMLSKNEYFSVWRAVIWVAVVATAAITGLSQAGISDPSTRAASTTDKSRVPVEVLTTRQADGTRIVVTQTYYGDPTTSPADRVGQLQATPDDERDYLIERFSPGNVIPNLSYRWETVAYNTHLMGYIKGDVSAIVAAASVGNRVTIVSLDMGLGMHILEITPERSSNAEPYMTSHNLVTTLKTVYDSPHHNYTFSARYPDPAKPATVTLTDNGKPSVFCKLDGVWKAVPSLTTQP
jgi:hypothetical protein